MRPSHAPWRIKKATPYLIGTFYFLTANLIRYLLIRSDPNVPLIEAAYAAPPLAVWLAVRLSARWSHVAITTFLTAAAVTLADVVAISSRQYHWIPSEVRVYLYAWLDLPWHVIGPIILFSALTGASSTAIFAIFGFQRIKIFPIICCLLILIIADNYMGTTRFKDTTSKYNILTIASIAVPLRAALNGFTPGKVAQYTRKSMLSDMRNTPATAILSVGVESFGLARRADERQLLISPLMDKISPFYSLTFGVHPFNGSTLAGELRELCGFFVDGVPNKNDPHLKRCLPNRLRHLGYQTSALHGNGGSIYNRSEIYPAIGFGSTWFFDRIQKHDQYAATCSGKAFSGICDVRVYRRAMSLFDGTRRLVHVMTLDAHLPLESVKPTDCPRQFSSIEAMCAYAHITRASFDALGSEIVKSRIKPTVIVIFGDHTPPFLDRRARVHFSQVLVPYIVLRRKMQ